MQEETAKNTVIFTIGEKEPEHGQETAILLERGGKAALLAGNLAVRENSIQITVSGEANHINRMTEKTGISEISQNSVE